VGIFTFAAFFVGGLSMPQIRYWRIFQKLGSVGEKGLSQEMDISQTINGVTVRLQVLMPIIMYAARYTVSDPWIILRIVIN